MFKCAPAEIALHSELAHVAGVHHAGAGPAVIEHGLHVFLENHLWKGLVRRSHLRVIQHDPAKDNRPLSSGAPASKSAPAGVSAADQSPEIQAVLNETDQEGLLL